MDFLSFLCKFLVEHAIFGLPASNFLSRSYMAHQTSLQSVAHEFPAGVVEEDSQETIGHPDGYVTDASTPRSVAIAPPDRG